MVFSTGQLITFQDLTFTGINVRARISLVKSYTYKRIIFSYRTYLHPKNLANGLTFSNVSYWLKISFTFKNSYRNKDWRHKNYKGFFQGGQTNRKRHDFIHLILVCTIHKKEESFWGKTKSINSHLFRPWPLQSGFGPVLSDFHLFFLFHHRLQSNGSTQGRSREQKATPQPKQHTWPRCWQQKFGRRRRDVADFMMNFFNEWRLEHKTKRKVSLINFFPILV